MSASNLRRVREPCSRRRPVRGWAEKRGVLRRLRTGLIGAAIAAGAVAAASAQAPDDEALQAGGGPATSSTPAAAAAAPSSSPSIASSLGPWADPGGVRAALAARGIAYKLIYIGDALANPFGGARPGAAYSGRLDAQLDVDFGKLAALPGLTLHANAYQIHGRGLSQCCLENLLVASGIEALPSTRLYELYVEQEIVGDRVTVRAGQLGADTEFVFSRIPALFINSTFGWPAITAVNLPSGGPAYPLATPGIRLKVMPTEALTLRAAVFNGDPAGPADDPQVRNRTGTNFRIGDPPLFMAEARYGFNEAPGAAGLPGSIKLGAWAHAGRFQDQRFANLPTPDAQGGLSVRDPALGGPTPLLQGNAGIYGILTQMIYRVLGSTDQGIGVFVRAGANPSDRNLIASYFDLGLTAKGMIPGRANDTFGVAYAQANTSRQAREAAALSFGSATGSPIKGSEAVFALTYQAEIAPGWTLQPDLQYVLRPGAGLAGSPAGQRTAENALVLGLRTTVQY